MIQVLLFQGVRMDIEKVKQKTVVEQVMEKIKDLIASGELKTNDRLPTENQLAEMFGVARSTIREAIRVFIYLGVFKSKIGKGTFVSNNENISKEALTFSILLGGRDMYEIIHLRKIIEYEGLRTIVTDYKNNPDQTKDYIKRLQKEIDNMKVAIKESNFDSLIQADYNFHSIIIKASKNSLLSDIFSTLRVFMLEEITKAMHKNIADEVPEHSEYLEAVISGDHSKAKKMFDEHINSTLRDLKKRL